MAFAGEAEKPCFLRPKTLIFDRKSQKYIKNKKYVKIQGFLALRRRRRRDPLWSHQWSPLWSYLQVSSIIQKYDGDVRRFVEENCEDGITLSK